MHKPDAAITMIQEAPAAGIPAQYILMDTWFTNEPFIKRIPGCGLDVIGMLKNSRQMYHFNGGLYNLDSLAAYFVRMNTPGDILGSVLVRTKKEHIPVKLVFVRNRNNRGEYIVLPISSKCIFCSIPNNKKKNLFQLLNSESLDTTTLAKHIPKLFL